MGILMRTVEFPDLHRYEPEFNQDGSEKHITCDGARFHVVSYGLGPKGAVIKCSEPNCEINKRNPVSTTKEKP